MDFAENARCRVPSADFTAALPIHVWLWVPF
jgi:hypothetical protein